MTTKTFDVGEIRERGFEILDEALKEGPVHITKGSEPAYVLVSEEDYAQFVGNGENDMDEEEPFEERMRKSLEDIGAGRVSRGTAEDLLKELGIRQ